MAVLKSFMFLLSLIRQTLEHHVNYQFIIVVVVVVVVVIITTTTTTITVTIIISSTIMIIIIISPFQTTYFPTFLSFATMYNINKNKRHSINHQ